MKFQKIIVIIMILLIIIPVSSMLLGKGDIYSINENRYKKELPEGSIAQIATGDGSYFNSLSETFNDNFGCRDLLIRFKNQIAYSLFHYSKELYFGKDNYMSYFSVVALEQVYNEEITEERYNNIINSHKEIQKELSDRDIQVVFLLAPQVNTVFPERTESFPVNRKDPTMYERFIGDCLSSELKDSTINVKEVLKAAEEKAPTYYKQDFHWNDWGAASAYGAAVNLFAENSGMNPLFNGDDLIFSTFRLPALRGGQVDSLAVVLPPDFGEATTVSKQGELTSESLPVELPLQAHLKNTKPGKLKGTAVCIGDSYMAPALYSFNGTNSGIIDYFDEVYSIHWDNAEGALNSLPENTKYVIIENIESGFFNYDEKLSKLLN